MAVEKADLKNKGETAMRNQEQRKEEALRRLDSLNLNPLSSTEWERDRADLKDGYPFAYVENLSTPDFSEFGSVGIEVCVGRLVRTA